MPPKKKISSRANKKKEEKSKKEQIVKEKQIILDSARKATDILSDFSFFTRFNKNGLDLHLEFFSVDQVDAELGQWLFDLLKRNMYDIYESPQGWGWKEGKEKKSLKDSNARFLVCFENIPSESKNTDQTPKEESKSEENESKSNNNNNNNNVEPTEQKLKRRPVAYTHFLFDWELDRIVLYCYEVQLEDHVRRKGLGKFLMQLLCLIGAKYKMQAVMLSCIKANLPAIKFYQSLNFKLDETDPSFSNETAVYSILSKNLQ